MNKEALKFPAESNWDAIINHWGLDVVEEANFEKYIINSGYTKNAEWGILNSLYAAWENEQKEKRKP